MDKKLKSEVNNEWASLPEETCNDSCKCSRKDKTATDNQWTSTAKNNPSSK